MTSIQGKPEIVGLFIPWEELAEAGGVFDRIGLEVVVEVDEAILGREPFYPLSPLTQLLVAVKVAIPGFNPVESDIGGGGGGDGVRREAGGGYDAESGLVCFQQVVNLFHIPAFMAELHYIGAASGQLAEEAFQ